MLSTVVTDYLGRGLESLDLQRLGAAPPSNEVFCLPPCASRVINPEAEGRHHSGDTWESATENVLG